MCDSPEYIYTTTQMTINTIDDCDEIVRKKIMYIFNNMNSISGFNINDYGTFESHCKYPSSFFNMTINGITRSSRTLIILANSSVIYTRNVTFFVEHSKNDVGSL